MVERLLRLGLRFPVLFRFSRWSIRAQLVFLVLLVFVPVFTAFLNGLANERQVARAVAYVRLTVQADSIARGLKAFFDSNEAVLGRFALRPLVRQLDARHCDPMLRDYVSLHPEFTNVVVRDVAGVHECSVFPGTVPQAGLLALPWFQQALSSKDVLVSDAFLGPQSGRWVAVMSHPVRDDAGKKTGLLILPMDLLNLNRKLLGTVPPGTLVTVTDDTRKIVLRSADPEKWMGHVPPAKTAAATLGQATGWVDGPGLDGVPRLSAFTQVPGMGWRVVAGMREDEAFAASDAAFLHGLQIGLFILLAALALAWWIGRGMVRPIESLVRTVAQLAGGDTTARVPLHQGPMEIESVAQAFNRMLEVRASVEAALRRSEESLSTTLYSIGDAVIATDAQGFITRMNPSAERLTAWSWAEALGKPLAAVFNIVHAQTRQAVADPVQRVMETGDVVGLASHTVLLARDGREHQISDSAAPIRDSQGRILGVVLVFSDVSEQYRVQDALRVREERMSFLLTRTSAVIRTVNAFGDFAMTFVSDSVYDLLGFEASQFTSDAHFWASRVHPDDEARLNAARQTLFEHSQVVHEYRFRHQNGSYRWLLDEARLLHDAQGQPTELIGVWIDITERKRADAALHESQERYRALVERSPVGVAVHRLGRLVYVNPAALAMIGARASHEVLGKPIMELVHPDDRQAVLRRAGDAMEKGIDEPLAEEKFLRLDGSTLEVETQGTVITYDGERAIQVSFQDIGARRQMEKQSESERGVLEQMVRGEPLLATLMHLALSYEAMWPDMMCAVSLLDPAGRHLRFGAAPRLPAAYVQAMDGLEIGPRQGSCGTAAFGGEAAVVADIAHDALWVHFRDLALRHGIRACWSLPILSTRGRVLGTFALYHGAPRAAQAEELAMLKRGADLASLAMERDQVAAQINQLAFYDALTRLPNRRLLVERLKIAILTSVRHRQHGAVLFIDLDNFKSLNDTQGHDVGDLLLQQVACRVQACVREADTVARLGGDEFVVMLEDLSEDAAKAASQAKDIGQKILATFAQPFDLNGRDHLSTPSIGVTLFGESAPGVDELLKQADLAMYQAKAGGRNTLRFFDADMQSVVENRVAMEADLRDGLRRCELLLHYQPVVQVNGVVTGAEALVRWQQPERGLVSPGEFIGLAETSGLILPLGQWVLHTACTQLAAWSAHPDMAHLTMAVNVSTKQFREADFVGKVVQVLDETGVNPNRLKLELTESLLADNVEDIIEKMTALKARGVSFSLDDFGTGYSSLSYLKRLPLSQLKIDQSFVRDVLTDPNDAAIARTIVLLGQSLGLSVIAEGVETDGQRQFLADNGCEAYQGYFFSKPLPIDRFEAFVLHTH